MSYRESKFRVPDSSDYFIVISAGLYFFWHTFVTRELVYSLHSSIVLYPRPAGWTNGELDGQIAWLDGIGLYLDRNIKNPCTPHPPLHPEVDGVLLRYISIIFSIGFFLVIETAKTRDFIFSLGHPVKWATQFQEVLYVLPPPREHLTGSLEFMKSNPISCGLIRHYFSKQTEKLIGISSNSETGVGYTSFSIYSSHALPS
jgi:hypothetical protein